MMRLFLALLLLTLPATATAQQRSPQAAPASLPAVVEYYYRVRWGSMGEFLRLYRANHAPILAEMRAAGFITRIDTEQAFTHMAGGTRWDLRVTITFRDAESAITPGGAYEVAEIAATRRLFPDRAAHEAAEARRFALLDDHWDVIVTPVTED